MYIGLLKMLEEVCVDRWDRLQIIWGLWVKYVGIYRMTNVLYAVLHIFGEIRVILQNMHQNDKIL